MRSSTAIGLSDTLNDGTITGDERVDQAETDQPEGSAIMDMARQCLSDSTTYLDVNWRQQWENNHENFQSRHPKGSRYHKAAYAHRSRLFMPKTRSVGLRWEAAVSSSLFSTNDIINVEAENQDDPIQAAGARLWKDAFQYRLKNHMQWYLTVLGAAQDAFKTGICISHNYWNYKEDAEGNVVKDTLACDLIPAENFRFSPSADWRDVAQDSPYLIHIMPMRASAVLGKMARGEWIPASMGRVRAATRPFQSNNVDETPKDDADTVPMNAMVYVYKFIMNIDEVDYIWFTLGTETLLTAPTPLSEVNPDGMRNYTCGMMTFDTHQAVPQSPVEHLASLQASINETRNSRRDNVRQVVNKRVYVRRDSKIDMAALMKNIPGAVIPTNDPNIDVQEAHMSDVTSSSYKEEQFDNAGFDEIAGSFNQSSINTNRRMGETAAGMELLAADSNIMTEYKLEIFVQKWVLPTLQQLLIIEQNFDRDWMVIGKAAQSSGLADTGIVEITEDLLMQGITMSVSVGVDATNPVHKVNKLNNFAMSIANMGGTPNQEEFTKEIAGAMGYDNGMRFIAEPQEPQPDPMMELKQQEMQLRAQTAQMQQEEAAIKLELAKAQIESQGHKDGEERHLKQIELQIKRDDNDADRESRERIAQMNDATKREIEGLRADLARSNAVLEGKLRLIEQTRSYEERQGKIAQSVVQSGGGEQQQRV